jgi:hypothetical protein
MLHTQIYTYIQTRNLVRKISVYRQKRSQKVHFTVLVSASIATKGPHDYVQRLDHLRNVCYKHINLRIVFGVILFTELILVYYLIEN